MQTFVSEVSFSSTGTLSTDELEAAAGDWVSGCVFGHKIKTGAWNRLSRLLAPIFY